MAHELVGTEVEIYYDEGGTQAIEYVEMVEINQGLIKFKDREGDEFWMAVARIIKMKRS